MVWVLLSIMMGVFFRGNIKGIRNRVLEITDFKTELFIKADLTKGKLRGKESWILVGEIFLTGILWRVKCRDLDVWK